MAFNLGFKTFVIINVMPRKMHRIKKDMTGLTTTSTMHSDTATTISVTIWINTRISWKALGISLSVSRNTVGISAPKYSS